MRAYCIQAPPTFAVARENGPCMVCAQKNRLNDDTSKRNVIMDIFGRDAATLSGNVMLTL